MMSGALIFAAGYTETSDAFIIVLFGLYGACLGFLLPSIQAKALSGFGKNAGVASGVLGFFQMTLSALGGSVASLTFGIVSGFTFVMLMFPALTMLSIVIASFRKELTQ